MSRVARVDLGERSYDIHVGPGVLARLGALCAEARLGRSCLVVSDTNVGPLYGAACAAALEGAGIAVRRLDVPAGESSKDWNMLPGLFSAAIEAGLDRSSFVVALGGGVVGDLAGFMAASYLRGIRSVQVPTSLLAMVDSSVGGKTGVNLAEGKNLVGAFHQPSLVVADLKALRTLPTRDFAAGLAEVVKYGVIRDAALFELVEGRAGDFAGLPGDLLETVVARCCEIKADIVGLDERESGLRAILNYGHTLGHALEKTAGYGGWLHGEAVAVGMAYAARLSARLAGLAEAEAGRLTRLLRTLGLPVAAPSAAWPDLRAAMSVDKKTTGGVPRFVLARRLGWAEPGFVVPEPALEEAWHVGGE